MTTMVVSEQFGEIFPTTPIFISETKNPTETSNTKIRVG